MALPLRSLARDVAIYGLADVLLRASGILTMPIYTRIFSPEDYGVWGTIGTGVSLVGSILAVGGETTYARFFFEAKTLEEKQDVSTTWISFLALWSTGLVLLALPALRPASEWLVGSSAHALLVGLALFGAPLGLVNAMLGQVLRNEFRAKEFAALNVLATALTVGLSLVAVLALKLGLAGIFGGALVAGALMLPVRIWSARGLLRPRFSWRLLRPLVRFGAPLIPSSLAYIVLFLSNRLVLAKVSTLEQVGLFSVASQIVSVLWLAANAIAQAFPPHAIKLFEESPEEAPAFVGRTVAYLLVGFGTITVFVTAFGREIVGVLAAPAFYDAHTAIGPLALAAMAHACGVATGMGITVAKATHSFAALSWLAAIANVALAAALGGPFGTVGAAWAMAVSLGALTIAYGVVAQRFVPVVYDKRATIVTALLTIAFTIGAGFLPPLPLGKRLAAECGLFAAYPLLLVASGVLGRRELSALGALVVSRLRAATEKA